VSELPDEQSSTFNQEYDPHAKTATRLTIYCRLCRRIFPVTFKARPQARLRCLCGHEAPLAELDVFGSEDKAKEFAGLYEKLYQAAKQALRDANLPVPPTGRFSKIRDGEDPPSDIASVSASAEDMSDITSSYVGDGSDERENAAEHEAELREAVSAAKGVLARHDALTELVEHLYCIRHTEGGVLERFVAACREDMALAKDVVAEATRRKKAGEKVRVTFSSFKHLAIALEDEGDPAGALAVCEAAKALGLGGYDERATRLRSALGPSDRREIDGKLKLAKRSRDAWDVLPAADEEPESRPEPKKAEPRAESKKPEPKKPEPKKPEPKKAAPKKSPAASDEPPIGLLSSSSDAIIPSSSDLEGLLPEDEKL